MTPGLFINLCLLQCKRTPLKIFSQDPSISGSLFSRSTCTKRISQTSASTESPTTCKCKTKDITVAPKRMTNVSDLKILPDLINFLSSPAYFIHEKQQQSSAKKLQRYRSWAILLKPILRSFGCRFQHQQTAILLDELLDDGEQPHQRQEPVHPA